MAGTGNSTPQAGDAGVIPVPQAGEMPEASVYRPLHKQDDSDIQNVSASVGMLPSLIYPDPSEFIRQQWSSVDIVPQQQGGAYVHSTPLRPTQAMPPCMERVRNYQSAMHPTQYQASIPDWSGKGNIAASEVEQAQYVPQAGSSKGMSGQQPLIGHGSLASGQVEQPVQESSDEEENDRSKSTLSVQLKLVLNRFPAVTKELMQKRLQLYIVKHMQMLANMGQHVPE
ncbi:hypothetical protein C0995_003618, partial [Termitomyces sp. Mi166